MNLDLLQQINLILAGASVCLTWLVQILIYPNFLLLKEIHFKEYHTFHSLRITWIAAPIMLGELFVTSFVLWMQFDLGNLFDFLLVAFVWIVTFFWAVPAHERLGSLFTLETYRSLYKAHSIRTALWTVRLCLIFFKLNGKFGGSEPNF